MNWILTIARMLGTATPWTSWLVQLHAELSAEQLDERIGRLEDPISLLHEDVPRLSEAIYAKLGSAESSTVSLDEADYKTFSRPLAVLEAKGLVRGQHAIGKPFAGGLTVSDHSFALYMCARFEAKAKMDKLVDIVDSCRRGMSLRAQDVMKETGLANPIVVAVFKAFESKGLGICSREIGLNQYYMGKA